MTKVIFLCLIAVIFSGLFLVGCGGGGVADITPDTGGGDTNQDTGVENGKCKFEFTYKDPNTNEPVAGKYFKIIDEVSGYFTYYNDNTDNIDDKQVFVINVNTLVVGPTNEQGRIDMLLDSNKSYLFYIGHDNSEKITQKDMVFEEEFAENKAIKQATFDDTYAPFEITFTSTYPTTRNIQDWPSMIMILNGSDKDIDDFPAMFLDEYSQKYYFVVGYTKKGSHDVEKKIYNSDNTLLVSTDSGDEKLVIGDQEIVHNYERYSNDYEGSPNTDNINTFILPANGFVRDIASFNGVDYSYAKENSNSQDEAFAISPNFEIDLSVDAPDDVLTITGESVTTFSLCYVGPETEGSLGMISVQDEEGTVWNRIEIFGKDIAPNTAFTRDVESDLEAGKKYYAVLHIRKNVVGLGIALAQTQKVSRAKDKLSDRINELKERSLFLKGLQTLEFLFRDCTTYLK